VPGVETAGRVVDLSPTARGLLDPQGAIWVFQCQALSSFYGGFYHDGCFPDLGAVIDHGNGHFKLNLTANESVTSST
jgi:hypothetical protein